MNIINHSVLVLFLIINVQHVSAFRLQTKLYKQARSGTSEMFLKSPHVFDIEGYSDDIHRRNICAISVLIANIPALVQASEASAEIGVIRPLLDTFVSILSFMFICRTVLSWYPKTDLNKFPYSVIAWPTEPLSKPVRDFIPPAFGVDVSSIVWIMLLSFLREILTGQQGILTLIERS